MLRYESSTPPPFTNRWQKRPGPDFRRCAGITKSDHQCRAAAQHGRPTCHLHETKKKGDS